MVSNDSDTRKYGALEISCHRSPVGRSAARSCGSLKPWSPRARKTTYGLTINRPYQPAGIVAPTTSTGKSVKVFVVIDVSGEESRCRTCLAGFAPRSAAEQGSLRTWHSQAMCRISTACADAGAVASLDAETSDSHQAIMGMLEHRKRTLRQREEPACATRAGRRGGPDGTLSRSSVTADNVF